LTQTCWIRAGSGYCSSSEPRAFFGLGAAREVDQVEIRWPTGAVQTMMHVRADQVLRVQEK
jgi:enediyne biosynthesis protein E4